MNTAVWSLEQTSSFISGYHVLWIQSHQVLCGCRVFCGGPVLHVHQQQLSWGDQVLSDGGVLGFLYTLGK